MKNKRFFVFLGIFIVLLIVFISSGKLNDIIAMNLCKQGLNYKSQGQIALAEKKYLEALRTNPDYPSAKSCLYDLYKTEFFKYLDAKKYQKAIPFGDAALLYGNSSAITYDLGLCYEKLENFSKAAEYYKKVVDANPSDVDAQKKLENASLNSAMNNVVASEKAPSELYSLIKTDLGSDVESQVQTIFDLVWAIPNGKILLQSVWKAQVPIYIIETEESPDMHSGYVNGELTAKKIDIPLRTIRNLNNTSASARFRIRSFVTFMHEFGHAYASINGYSAEDSLEEEMGVTMIGMDIAYKVITGNYMDEFTTKERSMECMKSLLLSDAHKELPVYNGFNQKAINSGIRMPYMYLYSDLPRMYQQLLSEGRISHVPNLDKLIK